MPAHFQREHRSGCDLERQFLHRRQQVDRLTGKGGEARDGLRCDAGGLSSDERSDVICKRRGNDAALIVPF
jgi:hypothetical protein